MKRTRKTETISHDFLTFSLACHYCFYRKMIEYNFSTSRINISIYLNIFRLSFKMQMISKANIAYLS